MHDVEKIVEGIVERNRRVEAEKAWEVSVFRRMTIAVITYIIACILLWSLGSTQFFLQALVPAIGYVLSTLSLPWIKRWWMRAHRYTD